MGRQSAEFLNGEGAAWIERNAHKLPPKEDIVLDAIERAHIKPERALEIGSGTGWRLKRLAKEYRCYTLGIDPGADAGTDALYGTAAHLLATKESFDLVIYGFCLYLCDREELFLIATEGDRVLKDGGYLVIHDFFPDHPHKVPYHHKPGLFSYKMDHSKLFLANPTYRMIYGFFPEGADQVGVVILQKNMNAGWPA